MTTYNPYISPTNCIQCGAPIEQPKHGGRPRRFCNKAGCRKAASRAYQEVKQARLQQKHQEMLRRQWQRYDESTCKQLEEILSLDGVSAAARATQAIALELSARQRLAEARALVAQAEMLGRKA